MNTYKLVVKTERFVLEIASDFLGRLIDRAFVIMQEIMYKYNYVPDSSTQKFDEATYLMRDIKCFGRSVGYMKVWKDT